MPPTSSHPWRVAQIGLGHWYSAYNTARALREYPRATLVGVAWPHRAQREEFAATFGVPGYEDYEALLARDDVDIVLIATPVSDMSRLTRLAAAAGKHVLVGKPIAMTLAEADAMIDAVERTGIVCVPFQSQTRLRAAGLRARIDRGDVGALAVLHATARWSIAEDWFRSGAPGWFADPAHVPGGAFIDEGIYWLDGFRYLAGSEVVEVHARMANLVHTDLAVEDWGQAFLTFENGVRATLEAGWTIAAPKATGPSPKQNAVIRLEIVGTRGEITDQWFRMPGRAVLAAGAADWVYERQSEEMLAPLVPQPLDHLIDCLEQDRTPIGTLRDARASLAVALAAYQSAREGRTIRLN
jgi:predicted dehydrogenase